MRATAQTAVQDRQLLSLFRERERERESEREREQCTMSSFTGLFWCERGFSRMKVQCCEGKIDQRALTGPQGRSTRPRSNYTRLTVEDVNVCQGVSGRRRRCLCWCHHGRCCGAFLAESWRGDGQEKTYGDGSLRGTHARWLRRAGKRNGTTS